MKARNALKPSVILLATICFASPVRAQNPDEGKQLGLFPEAQEFSVLRDVTRRIYDESLNYWQAEIWRGLSSEIEEHEKVIASKMNDAQLTLEGYETMGETSTHGTLRPASPERDLLVLSAALEALKESEKKDNHAGKWQSALQLLEPYERDIRKPGLRPDIRLFAAILLSSAWLNLEKADRASDLLEDINSGIRNGDPRSSSLSPNEALLLLLQGDAAFSSYAYRESYELYQQAARAATALGSAELARLSEARLYWSAYRSGRFEAALGHFSEICRRDSYLWSQGTPSERMIFDEAIRVSGDVLYRLENDTVRKEFLNRENVGVCRAHAAARWIERLADSGRFEAAVAAFKEVHELASGSSVFVDAASKTTQVATRERPGFSEDTASEVVLIAAPLLEVGGVYQSQFGGDSVLEKKRAQYIYQFVLQAADQQFDSAARGADQGRYRSAVRLFDIRLREGDSFAEKPKAFFRLGLSLSEIDHRMAAKEALGKALAMGLETEQAQIAHESLCAIEGRNALDALSAESTAAWVNACETLVRTHPTLRSLILLHPATEQALKFDPSQSFRALEAAFIAVSANPMEFRELTPDIAQTLASSASSVLSGEAAREAFARIEGLLRGQAPQATLRVMEQANYTKHATEFEELKENGQFSAARSDLEDWVARNPDNIYFPMALASFLEELHLVRDWKRLVLRSRELLSLAVNRPQLLREGQESGSIVAMDRVRLLLALALEGTLRFDESLSELKTVENSQGASAVTAREILLKRYADALEDDEKYELWRRAVVSRSGLVGALRHQAIQSALVLAMEKSDVEKIRDWLALSSSEKWDDSNESRYTIRALNRLAQLSLDSARSSTLQLGDWGIPDLRSRSEEILLRRAVTATIATRLRRESDKKEGLFFAKTLLSELPDFCLSPSALLIPLRALEKLQQKSEPQVEERLVELAIQSLRQGAYDLPDSERTSSQTIKDAHALIELLVGRFRVVPEASDIVSWVGPNRPVFSDGTWQRISRSLAEEVRVDEEI